MTRWAAYLCLLVFGLIAPSALRGDVVSATGRPIAVDVKITALREGQLFYQIADGRQIARTVESIRYLQISGWERFNEAERDLRNGRIQRAIDAYEECLEQLRRNDPPADGPDRSLLVRCRLVRLYDQQGQFDLAVATYLAIIARMPEAVESLRPQRFPEDAPERVASAKRMVDRAIADRDRLDPVALSLEKWRATWPAATAEAESEPPATTQPATLPAESVVSVDRELEIALEANEAREESEAGVQRRDETRSQEVPLATRPASTPAAPDQGIAGADSGSRVTNGFDENGRHGGRPLPAAGNPRTGSAAGVDSGTQDALDSQKAGRMPAPPAGAQKTGSVPAPPIAALVDGGRFEAALTRLAAEAQASARLPPAEWHYWRGRALRGLASQGKDADANRRRAGLAFMRVVIHWPESPLAAECLYHAGVACREAGQTEQAEALWAELLAVYPQAGTWTQEARRELARLRTAGSAPAE